MHRVLVLNIKSAQYLSALISHLSSLGRFALTKLLQSSSKLDMNQKNTNENDLHWRSN